jgi:hypothetical protein
MAAGLGTAATGAGFGAGFVSSSAMIRRMEARISSIDGSCAFAGWFIVHYPRNSIPRPQHDTRYGPRGESLTWI